MPVMGTSLLNVVAVQFQRPSIAERSATVVIGERGAVAHAQVTVAMATHADLAVRMVASIEERGRCGKGL